MNSLRFIDDPPRLAALNMALDDVLGRRAAGAVLRLYRWAEPALSCGYHQNLEKRVDFRSCRRQGVAVVRRPTGGRELLHDGDVSFSLAAPANGLLIDRSRATEFFFTAGRIIAIGLKRVGIEAQVVAGSRKASDGKGRPCLVSASQYELVVDGKKLVPMAQRVYPRTILVHGSIPLRKPTVETASLLLVADRGRLQADIEASSADILSLSGNDVDEEAIILSMRESFESVFEGRIVDHDYLRDELAEANNESLEWEIKYERVA